MAIMSPVADKAMVPPWNRPGTTNTITAVKSPTIP